MHKTAAEIDHKHSIMDRSRAIVLSAQEAGIVIVDKVAEASAESGLTDALKTRVVDPATEVANAVLASPHVVKARELLERTYGDAREKFKPYFRAADAHELLRNTKAELAYVSACMLQVDSSESYRLADQFGRAVTAKIAGIGTTAALLALVSSLGTASTGTSIATLSGAAATKATMAWVGSMVGGGMAAGAFLTGGLSIVVGLGAYKALSSERRAFESLSMLEARLVESCWLLMSVCDSYLAMDASEFKSRDAKFLLEESLRPLYDELVDNTGVLCQPLDNKHAIAFRQHILTDFRRVVIDGFEAWLAGPTGLEFQKLSAEAFIGGVFYALMTRHALDDSIESQLVLDALRRSSLKLNDASEDSLGDYLRGQSEDGLKHVADSVKGIYHELMWVKRYNATHASTYAEVFPETNHPGADVVVRDSVTHEKLEEIQLKAVAGTSHVTEHLNRYPGTRIDVTDEVAEKMNGQGVGNSGFSNEALGTTMHQSVDHLHDHTILDRAENSALLAMGIGSAHEFIDMLRGVRRFPEAVINASAKAATAAGATALTALLFT